ncbi:hypothetical protein [Desulfoluna sp.]|uniref:hypothetical protein n=1 Tax=Desulfoluna sp. TaxID=2045199 RepID=UPI0026329C2C|nr:hypothetical protein [Desulfoluna sp.]
MESLIIGILGMLFGACVTFASGKQQTKTFINGVKVELKDKESVSLKEQFYLTDCLIRKIKRSGFKPDLIVSVCPGGAIMGPGDRHHALDLHANL